MYDLASYQDVYRNIRFERHDGILQMQIHTDGAEAVWEADPGCLHEQLGDAFYRVGHDRGNRIVILTGTGTEFLAKVAFTGAAMMNTGTWYRIFKEGRDLLNNLLEIDIPIIAAVNGPAFVHAELATLSDIVIAANTASFADKAHAPGGVVPGDGVHVWWQMLLGPNRARHFLLTGNEIAAEEALTLGFVAEVVPQDQVLARAWEVARDLAQKPDLMLRYSRVSMVQRIKRHMLDDLGYGLMLEGMGIFNLLGK
ncbi:enoyl-CoA hydratase/carnithine racemase [Sphingobium fontiphilum]|uniref:Enoyl-CoA hydratase/carnithine racemase n=1 Tax=Sphingobium fontiphilum TaxID=944425 RepID=A0A7W6DFQ1_9SPHN|nr:enoyl-CoA hydratase/isomerase family protein [Sphingobium fontiphilum]MBB3982238.1 enoyl-CoA hydratase/carnithine racemase [Sphingobium fontiphilum]